MEVATSSIRWMKTCAPRGGLQGRDCTRLQHLPAFGTPVILVLRGSRLLACLAVWNIGWCVRGQAWREVLTELRGAAAVEPMLLPVLKKWCLHVVYSYRYKLQNWFPKLMNFKVKSFIYSLLGKRRPPENPQEAPKRTSSLFSLFILPPLSITT